MSLRVRNIGAYLHHLSQRKIVSLYCNVLFLLLQGQTPENVVQIIKRRLIGYLIVYSSVGGRTQILWVDSISSEENLHISKSRHAAVIRPSNLSGSNFRRLFKLWGEGQEFFPDELFDPTIARRRMESPMLTECGSLLSAIIKRSFDPSALLFEGLV